MMVGCQGWGGLSGRWWVVRMMVKLSGLGWVVRMMVGLSG